MNMEPEFALLLFILVAILLVLTNPNKPNNPF